MDPSSKPKGRGLSKALSNAIYHVGYTVRAARGPSDTQRAQHALLRQTHTHTHAQHPHTHTRSHTNAPHTQAHRLAASSGKPSLPEEAAAAAVPLMAPWLKEATVR